MIKILDDKKREVSIYRALTLSVGFWRGGSITPDQEFLNESLSVGKESFGAGTNFLHVGKNVEKVLIEDYLVFVGIHSNENIANDPKPGGYPAGSTLVMMWYDRDLSDLPSKTQKYLKDIEWEKNATNLYT